MTFNSPQFKILQESQLKKKNQITEPNALLLTMATYVLQHLILVQVTVILKFVLGTINSFDKKLISEIKNHCGSLNQSRAWTNN